MNILAGFADISLGQLVLVGGMALLASIIGGLAGYGTGALMPLVLVPLIGAEPIAPVMVPESTAPAVASSMVIFCCPIGEVTVTSQVPSTADMR